MLRIVAFIALLFSFSAFSYTELSAQFSRQEQIYGDNKQNSLVTSTAGSSIAVYFLRKTALQLNYSNEKQIDNVDSSSFVFSGERVMMRSMKQVRAYSYGLGIKQAFARRRAPFRPAITIGYARRIVKDSTSFTMTNVLTNSVTNVFEVKPVEKQNTGYAILSLDIRLGRRFYWRISAQSMFKSSEPENASDNIKYMMGISLYL